MHKNCIVASPFQDEEIAYVAKPEHTCTWCTLFQSSGHKALSDDTDWQLEVNMFYWTHPYGHPSIYPALKIVLVLIAKMLNVCLSHTTIFILLSQKSLSPNSPFVTRPMSGVAAVAECIRIRTREGIYGKIWPEPEGLPEGNPKNSSLILPYIPIWVLIRTLSHS